MDVTDKSNILRKLSLMLTFDATARFNSTPWQSKKIPLRGSSCFHIFSAKRPNSLIHFELTRLFQMALRAIIQKYTRINKKLTNHS